VEKEEKAAQEEEAANFVQISDHWSRAAVAAAAAAAAGR
jgi:hypothetical protein